MHLCIKFYLYEGTMLSIIAQTKNNLMWVYPVEIYSLIEKVIILRRRVIEIPRKKQLLSVEAY